MGRRQWMVAGLTAIGIAVLVATVYGQTPQPGQTIAKTDWTDVGIGTVVALMILQTVLPYIKPKPDPSSDLMREFKVILEQQIKLLDAAAVEERRQTDLLVQHGTALAALAVRHDNSERTLGSMAVGVTALLVKAGLPHGGVR